MRFNPGFLSISGAFTIVVIWFKTRVLYKNCDKATTVDAWHASYRATYVTTCEAKADDGTFSVTAVASELGENSSAMEAKIEQDAKVTLNSRYLLDALNSTIEGKIIFSMSGKLDPIKIKNAKSDDYTHIIMPLNS